MSYNKKTKKEDKTDIKKMTKYTVKKILWLINYSLSFSKKDTGKEIGIKLLGCFVILQSISISFLVISSFLQVILIHPILTLGIFLLISGLVFKKEISYFLKPKNKKEFLHFK